jgi:hypothetical protein
VGHQWCGQGWTHTIRWCGHLLALIHLCFGLRLVSRKNRNFVPHFV